MLAPLMPPTRSGISKALAVAAHGVVVDADYQLKPLESTYAKCSMMARVSTPDRPGGFPLLSFLKTRSEGQVIF